MAQRRLVFNISLGHQLKCPHSKLQNHWFPGETDWGVTDQLQLRSQLSLELYHPNAKALSLTLASFHLLTLSGRILVLPAEVPSFKLMIKLSFPATGALTARFLLSF